MEHNKASSSGPKRAIMEELIRGRDLSNQLLQLFLHHDGHGSNTFGDESSSLLLVPFAQHLLNNILTSFTNTLLLFNSHQIPIGDPPKSEDDNHLDDDAAKSLNTRNGRGRYHRRRATQTWEKKSPILVDDGYAWRKYGQKNTMNAKYKRNYYRCSHKDDQGCPAMKQVQRIREKPPLYQTTYFGIHTCKNQLLPEIPLLDASSESSSLLSFNNTSLPEKQDHPFFSTTTKVEEISTYHHIDVKRNEHVATVSSSALDRLPSVKFQSIEVDDVILRCFEFDESVRFRP